MRKLKVIIILGMLLVICVFTGCTDNTRGSSEVQSSPPSESVSSSDISTAESSSAASEEESVELPPSSEGKPENVFLADMKEYLVLLDSGTFADVYAKDPNQRMYFSYNYGLYSSLALLDYSVITNDYPDINDWLNVEGELSDVEAGYADSFYDFEHGKYEMEDFPVVTVYISGDNLTSLYGDSITLEDMEGILGTKIETKINEMSGLLIGQPTEVGDYIVEVYFSPENTVSSIAISNK